MKPVEIEMNDDDVRAACRLYIKDKMYGSFIDKYSMRIEIHRRNKKHLVSATLIPVLAAQPPKAKVAA